MDTTSTIKSSLPVVISDIDGVVCNLIEQVTIAIWQDYNVLLPESLHTQFNTGEALYPHLRQFFSAPKAVLDYIWDRVFHNADTLQKANPYYEVLAAYHGYMRRGGDIYMYTSRSAGLSMLVQATNAWCDSWNLRSPYFVNGPVGKKAFVEGVVRTIRNIQSSRDSSVFVVDDDPDTLQVLMSIADAGVYVYMMPRPWNLNFTRFNRGFLHQLERAR